MLSSSSSESCCSLLRVLIRFSDKSVLMKIVPGNVFHSHNSGKLLQTHSCELTSLVLRKAAPIFFKVFLRFKLDFLASSEAVLIASEHCVSPLDIEHKYVTHLW